MTNHRERDNVDVGGLSTVAQDYVKAIWSAIEWGEPPITTKALAVRFGTSAANVTETMRRLAAQGLVNYQPYKSVELTDIGKNLAVAMVRRHRLIETFLVTTLGYNWNEIHDEADRLEHAASDLLISRIDSLLGHPAVDPHGDPIPTSDGQTHTIIGAFRLSDAGVGPHRVHRISDAEPRNLEAAAALGLTPGARVEVDEQDATGSIMLATPDGRRAVPESLALVTWVTIAR